MVNGYGWLLLDGDYRIDLFVVAPCVHLFDVGVLLLESVFSWWVYSMDLGTAASECFLPKVGKS